MRTAFLRLFIVAISVIGFSQNRQGILIQDGFLTGGDYVSETFSKAGRDYYALGFLNGLTVAPLFGGPRSLDWVSPCVRGRSGMTDRQIAAIIFQYIQKRPKEWHLPLNTLSFAALRDACAEYVKEEE